MWDYEGMKKAGLNLWNIRENGVYSQETLTEHFEALLNDVIEGKYQTDLTKVSVKCMLMRLFEESYNNGIEVGFTYSVPEYESWMRMTMEERYVY